MVLPYMNPWQPGPREALVLEAHGIGIRPVIRKAIPSIKIGSNLTCPDSQQVNSSNDFQSRNGQFLGAVFAATCAVMDRLNVAVILVNSSRQIALANSAALRVLARRDVLRATNGVLRLADHPCRRALEAFLNAQADAHTSNIKRCFMRNIGVGTNRCFLVAEHLKMPASCSPFALILIYEPHEVVQPDCKLLADLYGFTKRNPNSLSRYSWHRY